jgi:Bacterial extracellular solute-binding proteins, family 5 Middle
MDTMLATIFTDETAEFNNIQSATPSIDLTDWQLPSGLLNGFTTSNSFLISAQVPQVGYYEVEFHLGNNFWGCGFAFGTGTCGQQIRQGIAHMIDKSIFTATQPTVAGQSSPIDNPLPTSSAGGLISPNPCGYDASFVQTFSQCAVGAAGGLSYHLANAGGANGIAWLQSPGSLDLNAAAQHFVNAGVATGFSTSTSVLTGISAAAAANVPNFFIRSDNVPRLDLGNSIAEQICYLFTGAYTTPCPYLSIVRGPITAFPGFTTSKTSVNLNWWMYTAAFSGPTFFDGSLYFGYNSKFVSGIPSIQTPTGTCDSTSVPTASAGNFQYVCNPSFDNMSSQMETAPCLSAAGDPAAGAGSNLPTGPNNGICPGFPGKLSAHSAGIQAEAIFGANALTIPVFQLSVQFGYLNNGWSRVANNSLNGISNFFTWLNAWNPSPVQSGTIRQGFKETTRSVNPYIVTTVWDVFINGEVYDTLYAPNPLSPADVFNWMTISTFQKDNASLGYPTGLQAPAHTLTTYRFTLRDDLYFQDGRPVTSYDVAFSYLSLVGSGAFAGSGAAPMTGITILSPHQFDIGVNSLGPFTLPTLTALTIEPGRYWTSAGTSPWDTAVTTCTSGAGCPDSQYVLSGPNVLCNAGCTPFSTSLMTIDPNKTAATYDPISNHIFVGSGPFQCGTVTSSGSGTCTSTGAQNPPTGGSYTLARFGKGLAPASSVSGIYFRSSGNAALHIWSQQNDLNPSTIFGLVAACYLKPVDLTGSCAHFQQGIGGFNGLGGAAAPVNAAQVAIENRFYALNWVAPFNWATAPPLGIASLTGLVLYEGGVTLAPASLVGCPAGYDC